jgi:hypothetical protein
MPVAQTSREAYTDYMNSPAPGRHEDLICEYLGTAGCSRTRMEIAQATCIRLSSVCATVNRLVKECVLIEGKPRPCLFTGRKAKVLRLA